MQIILLEKVDHLGRLGDEVSVKPGFGRNYLIPKGRAVLATRKNREKFEERRADLEAAEATLVSAAEKRAKQLDQFAISFAREVTEEGALYGSVSVHDIAEAVVAAGKELAKSEVSLPDGPIKAVGEYDVTVRLHGDVLATLKVIVNSNVVAESSGQ